MMRTGIFDGGLHLVERRYGRLGGWKTALVAKMPSWLRLAAALFVDVGALYGLAFAMEFVENEGTHPQR